MPALHPFLRNRRDLARTTSPVVLEVAFASASGERRRAIGGGATFADAVEFARESLPLGHDWRLLDWADVYGD